ncbi:MAG: protein kinase [Chthoniobacterales bacterium]|nr:protein kinase [Chthoniobacterales bacterium]
MSELTGLSASFTGMTERVTKCERCGLTTQVGQGICASCLLREAMEAEGEASAELFESVLTEADVPDKEWHLGNYEILEEIGRGGMGVIYRARQRHSRRIVALKRVLAYQTDSHETLARFRREAEAAAGLDHPNILPIYEVSESEDGLPFFSMKYATGGSLRAALPRLRNKPNECARLLAKVARAIDYAHHAGILHRDLQPGNILLDSHGEPMVSDFGLAKWLTEESDLTQSLTTFGTPGYIAPEQAAAATAELTPAADTYSLGAILFHLLTGRPPFTGTNVLSVIHQASITPAPHLRTLAPSLDRDLETIVVRALEREPGARYQSAGALAEDLECWLEGRPIHTRPILPPARLWRWARRNPILSSAVTACLILTTIILWLLRSPIAKSPDLPLSSKSIAVLPFQALVSNKENAEFAAGIQDDLLTSLAQIHDLKVISRTSVAAYQKPDGRDVREIGKSLGVANILQGSVRREGNRVLINVQLIDARNDRHLWAEHYDRIVADSIGLQGELATQIAATLDARLAPEEKARLEVEPTTNSEAYVLYLKAVGKEATRDSLADEIAVEQLLMQATALDPNFALAHAEASLVNSWVATQDEDQARKAKARAQAEEALRLAPTLGEAHMAMGLCLFWGEKKYDAALKEFKLSVASSPNNAVTYVYMAGIYRRQGRWRDSVASFDRALALDPRNTYVIDSAAENHVFVRDWPAAVKGFTRALEITPDDTYAKTGLAYLEVFRNGNPAAGRKILQSVPARSPPDGDLALASWDLAMLERDYASAEKVLRDYPLDNFRKNGEAPKTFFQARTALAHGDAQSAQRYFAAALPALKEWQRKDPNDDAPHARLGLLYALIKRKEEALQEARRAVELEPESQNAFHGAGCAGTLALVYALTGEQEQALALIERLLTTPGPVEFPDFPENITRADLRLRWEWDSLRSNPRFQKILAAPEPRTVLDAAR